MNKWWDFFTNYILLSLCHRRLKKEMEAAVRDVHAPPFMTHTNLKKEGTHDTK